MTQRVYSRTKDKFHPDHAYYTRHMGAGDFDRPDHVDLSNFCSPVENQGQTSSCTGHAIIGAVEIDENINRQANGHPFINYSRLFVYYNERWMENDVNEDGGAAISDGIASLSIYGVCEESLWPFSETAVLLKPSMEAYEDALKHKASAYERVPQSEEALMHVLAVTQRPIVFGIMIYESFESDEVAQSGRVPMPRYGERCLGGHAVLITGYDLPTRQFKVRNSWGPDWGDGGSFWLPFDYVLRDTLAEDFWVVQNVAV